MLPVPLLGLGSSTTDSMSTEQSWVLSSQDSSSPDDSKLDLALSLTLGCASVSRIQLRPSAEDFPSVASSSSSAVSSCSSSSSSSLSRTNVTARTQRSADSIATANCGGHVVGWPPVRAHRMNGFSNQAKSRSSNTVVETINESDERDCNVQEKRCPRSSSFVKVNMDGTPIGRKVDLDAHGCYETLAETLEDMFLRHPTIINTTQEPSMMVGITGQSKLLDGSSGFALTYEDKDGDWMLVGDVPWMMFLGSVRRLRIMRL